MFIFNVKLNGKLIFKIFIIIVVISIITMFGVAAYKVFNESAKVNDKNSKKTYDISPQNYTNILKSVHDNSNEYIGNKIKFSGYIYRLIDFTENEFVLARDMVISSDFQTVVVGFLCNYDKAKDFEDGCWVEITGNIKQGTYHGEIPIISIESITRIEKPSDEYVYPPDDNYIPTSCFM